MVLHPAERSDDGGARAQALVRIQLQRPAHRLSVGGAIHSSMPSMVYCTTRGWLVPLVVPSTSTACTTYYR
jgi:hypothetical protein